MGPGFSAGLWVPAPAAGEGEAQGPGNAVELHEGAEAVDGGAGRPVDRRLGTFRQGLDGPVHGDHDLRFVFGCRGLRALLSDVGGRARA